MSAKKIGITAGLLLALLLTISLYTEIPSQLGLWLRMLSLSGNAGNIAAWAAVLFLTALPALAGTLARLENAVSPSRTLAGLLRGAACLYLCLSGWEHAVALYRNISQVMEGNTDLSAPEVRITCVILVLLTILDMIPAFLGSMVLIWGGGLARAGMPCKCSAFRICGRLTRMFRSRL